MERSTDSYFRRTFQLVGTAVPWPVPSQVPWLVLALGGARHYCTHKHRCIYQHIFCRTSYHRTSKRTVNRSTVCDRCLWIRTPRAVQGSALGPDWASVPARASLLGPGLDSRSVPELDRV